MERSAAREVVAVSAKTAAMAQSIVTAGGNPPIFIPNEDSPYVRDHTLDRLEAKRGN